MPGRKEILSPPAGGLLMLKRTYWGQCPQSQYPARCLRPAPPPLSARFRGKLERGGEPFPGRGDFFPQRRRQRGPVHLAKVFESHGGAAHGRRKGPAPPLPCGMPGIVIARFRASFNPTAG